MPKINQTVHHSSGTHVKGAELPADHALVRSAPHLFSVEQDVEQATAAPGEKRSIARSPKKAAAKKSASKSDD